MWPLGMCRMALRTTDSRRVAAFSGRHLLPAGGEKDIRIGALPAFSPCSARGEGGRRPDEGCSSRSVAAAWPLIRRCAPPSPPQAGRRTSGSVRCLPSPRAAHGEKVAEGRMRGALREASQVPGPSSVAARHLLQKDIRIRALPAFSPCRARGEGKRYRIAHQAAFATGNTKLMLVPSPNRLAAWMVLPCRCRMRLAISRPSPPPRCVAILRIGEPRTSRPGS